MATGLEHKLSVALAIDCRAGVAEAITEGGSNSSPQAVEQVIFHHRRNPGLVPNKFQEWYVERYQSSPGTEHTYTIRCAGNGRYVSQDREDPNRARVVELLHHETCLWFIEAVGAPPNQEYKIRHASRGALLWTVRDGVLPPGILTLEPPTDLPAIQIFRLESVRGILPGA